MSWAARAPLTSVEPRPFSGAETCTVPISSAFFSSRLRTLICAPSAVSTSSSVARVGLRPSESSTSAEPGKSAAAQRKNAAEETSPGTKASIA